MKEDKYFATLPKEEIGQRLMEKIENYYNFITTNNRADVWDAVHRQFYRGYYSKAQIKSVGKNKNKKELSINNFRNILQHIVILTTNDRPAYTPRAINSDYDSLAQVKVAKNLLDYYMTKDNLEDQMNKLVQYAVVYGEGWIFLEWDNTIGDIVASEDGEKMIRAGDIAHKIFTPHDVIRDPSKQNISSQEWFIVVEEVNKYEYAKKFPKWEEEILGLEYEPGKRWRDNVKSETLTPDTDAVTMYTFIHKKTTAVPDGRIVKFFDDKIVVYVDDLPYDDFPLVGVIPDVQDFSPFGYSVSFDMLSIQQASDGVNSTVATNQAAFGIQNVLCPKGAGIQEQTLSGGLKVIYYNSATGKPEPLNLTYTPPEVVQTGDKYDSSMETISGVNSVARGNPEASLRSGNALALVHSTAIQFNRGLQRSYVRSLELVGTALINILKRYAKTARVIKIAGVNNRQYIDEFKGDDISAIDLIAVDVGNPMTRTTAFKVEAANNLLEKGLLTNPKDYLQVFSTGNLEAATSDSTNESMLIESENEKLMRGEQVEVIAIEDHVLHVNKHKTVLYSPEAKENADLVKNVLDHITKHYQEAQTFDPGLLTMLGIQPMPQQEQQGGQAGKAPTGMAPDDGALGEMPNMPTNPMTNETYNPEAGE